MSRQSLIRVKPYSLNWTIRASLIASLFACKEWDPIALFLLPIISHGYLNEKYQLFRLLVFTTSNWLVNSATWIICHLRAPACRLSCFLLNYRLEWIIFAFFFFSYFPLTVPMKIFTPTDVIQKINVVFYQRYLICKRGKEIALLAHLIGIGQVLSSWMVFKWLRSCVSFISTHYDMHFWSHFVGSVYVLGGIVEGGNVVAQVNRLNLHDGSNNTVSPMTEPRYAFSAVASGGCVLVFGGFNEMSSCEKYDPKEDSYVSQRYILIWQVYIINSH